MAKVNNNVINRFTGDDSFLSNFYHSPIEYEGILYPTVENAFHSAKTFDQDKKIEISKMTPSLAKAKGRSFDLRPDWEEVKLGIMEDVLRLKFQDRFLQQKLVMTGNKELIEGNHWNDTFWGVCNGIGQNHLGKLLMKLRDEFKQDETLFKSNKGKK